MNKMDFQGRFHKYDTRVQCQLANIAKNEHYGDNPKIYQDFFNYLGSIELSKPRIAKYLDSLRTVEKIIKKPFREVNKTDLEAFLNEINNRKYSVWTKRDFKLTIKIFYRWLYESEEYPELVKWIKPKVKKKDQPLKSSNDLLTKEEIKRMLAECENARDKAIIAILYESGARIGEIGTLRIKNIEIDKFGALLSVNGKTGHRIVRIISSTHYLMSWLESHPAPENMEAPLWTGFGKKSYEMLGYAGMSRMIRKITKKAGINKRVHAHLFRHSRATHLADDLTEFQMNHYFGWIQGSNMPSTYIHISGKQMDKAILEINGIKTPEKEKKQPESKECPRCGHINPTSINNCLKCVSFLDQKAVYKQEEYDRTRYEKDKKANELLNSMMKDPEIQEIMLRKMREQGRLGEIVNI